MDQKANRNPEWMDVSTTRDEQIDSSLVLACNSDILDEMRWDEMSVKHICTNMTGWIRNDEELARISQQVEIVKEHQPPPRLQYH